ncbi:hypothetical protein [Rhizobium sp. Leaf391]|uniref:hypothetical protein n=1 Tax=Rhizobium sp. Leaf391 TaxID=1736360 RepID=UPI000DE0778C|nr:hypothetical protein [Rhizobium sp. Leaf391]
MSLYAWTIRVPGREPIARVTDIAELHGVMRVLDLPGLLNPTDITGATNGIVPDNGKFRHVDANDGFDWSVAWTRLDGIAP